MNGRYPAIVDPLFGEELSSGEMYNVLSEKTFSPRLSTAKSLYYSLRPYIPLPVRWMLQSAFRPRNVDPDWHTTSRLLIAYARRIGAGNQVHVAHVWPAPYSWALLLTHDVETSDGIKTIEKVASLEEKYGFRSSWNFVPYSYHVDAGLLSNLRARGFEIGIHDYNHDGRLYSSRQLFNQRFPLINSALKNYDSTGFRSAAMHRNLVWQQELDVEYDASTFDVDPFQPMPGGCASIWPFIVGTFVEIPYTLPQDHVLFKILNERDISVWKKKTRWLIQRRGMVCIITHPDYLAEKALFRAYEALLDFLAGMEGGWKAIPREVAKWWRRRATDQKEGISVKSANVITRPLRIAPTEDMNDLLFTEP